MIVEIDNEKLGLLVCELIDDVNDCDYCSQSELVIGQHSKVYISIVVTNNLPDNCFSLSPDNEVIKVIK